MTSLPEPRVTLPTALPDPSKLAPYPGGDMPVDRPGEITIAMHRWNTKRWKVWGLLHQGHSNSQVAKMVGFKSEDSVRQLRKAWRQRYGILITAKSWNETLADPRYARPVTAEEVEGATNHAHLVIGTNARELAQLWMSEFLGDTDEAKARRSKLTATEVKVIQEIGLTAERASQGVLEAPRKGRAGQGAAEPATPAQKAVKGLSAPAPRKGPKGAQAEAASATVVGLRSELSKFRDALNQQQAG